MEYLINLRFSFVFAIILRQKRGDSMTNKEVIFNSLNFGNLILAKRQPNTKDIQQGHRNGPFLVLGRKDDHLICLYATSKDYKDSLIRFSKSSYNLHKDTYITSDIRLISINEFITTIYCINEKEKKNLIKFLYINGLKNCLAIDEPTLEIGDIIQLKNQHLIIGETEENYITIKAYYNTNSETYAFDYRNKNFIQKEHNYRRVAFLSEEETNKCVAEAKKNYNQKRNGKIEKKIPDKIETPLKVGNLIIYNNLLYYLYYELGDKKLSFAVSKNETSLSKQIIIGGDVYYANFGNKKDFDKNQDNTLLVATASEEEKKLIKSKRNSRD